MSRPFPLVNNLLENMASLSSNPKNGKIHSFQTKENWREKCSHKQYFVILGNRFLLGNILGIAKKITVGRMSV